MPTEPDDFAIVSRDEAGRRIVTVRGELDLATSPELEALVLEALDAGERVLLDLRELGFMDSSGVRVLVTAHARAGAGGERFAIVRPHSDSEVRRIIEVSGLEAELRLVDDADSF